MWLSSILVLFMLFMSVIGLLALFGFMVCLIRGIREMGNCRSTNTLDLDEHFTFHVH